MATIGEAAQEIQIKLSNGEKILDFIDNDNLIACVDDLFNIINTQLAESNTNDKILDGWDFWENGIDPFSTISSTIVSEKNSIEKHLLEVEKIRQIDKTISNAIGHFHQKLLGCLDGCVNPGMNGQIDLIVNRPSLLLIAEIKNKWNTTKGDDRAQPYDKLEHLIESIYPGYTAYYVCIISKPSKKYGYRIIDRPFTPSAKGSKRPFREDIREIDGKSFYALLTGKSDSLLELYKVFPKLLAYSIHRADPKKTTINLIDERDYYFNYLWSHIYGDHVKPGDKSAK